MSEMKQTRPRKAQVIEYPENEIGFVVLPRNELLGEVDAVVNNQGQAYVHRSLVGKKVKIFILRDDDLSVEEDKEDIRKE